MLLHAGDVTEGKDLDRLAMVKQTCSTCYNEHAVALDKLVYSQL